MPAPFILGWEEWLALPDLGIPAIKAKIDTGARTSALHAFQIEPFGPINAPLVRFTVHPIARRDDIEIVCSAPIVARREVTSSNGESELRYVIATRVQMGDREWPIDITLTNRATMSYRMLIGRQAIREDMYVDPASSFRQPRLSGKVYRKLRPPAHARRPLRIAILSRKPGSNAPMRLAAAAEARGHVVERLDLAQLSLRFKGLEPGCLDGDEPVPHFDAVIPRIGGAGGQFARGVLRQLELMGSYTPNRADALERLASPLAVRQTLLRHGIVSGGPAVVADVDHDHADQPPGEGHLSLLVIGRKAVARQASADEAAARRVDAAAAATFAEQVAEALELRLAAITLAVADDGFAFAAVDPVPRIAGFSRAGGVDVGSLVVADLEASAAAWRRIAVPPPSSPS